MSPSAITETVAAAIPVHPETAPTNGKAGNTSNGLPSPLTLGGALDNYEHFDVTPIIGREFPTANLVEWLDAPNADELIRDLAITSTLQPSLSSLPL